MNARNIGAEITAKIGAIGTAVAAGAGDNTALVGQVVDRLAFGDGAGAPLSAVGVAIFKTTLADGKTLSLTWKIEHGNDVGLSDTADLQTKAKAVVSTGGAGGSTNYGAETLDIDLSGCKRYIRITVTPDLDAANTDTASLSTALIFGGFARVPIA